MTSQRNIKIKDLTFEGRISYIAKPKVAKNNKQYQIFFIKDDDSKELMCSIWGEDLVQKFNWTFEKDIYIKAVGNLASYEKEDEEIKESITHTIFNVKSFKNLTLEWRVQNELTFLKKNNTKESKKDKEYVR